jgi:hypothetical protein
MNPGLPGLGIGGLFYLISALAMPLVAFVRHLCGQPARWGLACRQALMAAGIFGSMALVFAMLDVVFGPRMLPAGAAGTFIATISDKRISVMVVTLAVLAVVLASMHVVRLTMGVQRTARRRALTGSARGANVGSSARPATIGLE